MSEPTWRIIEADCIEAMRELDEASVDAIVCDPPYGLEFMGKEWDRFAPEAPTRRSGWDQAQAGEKLDGDSSKPHGRVAFGKRRGTYRCSGCGKRDAFRNEHGCDGEWVHEWVDPQPLEALSFQEWSRLWAVEALRVLKPGGHLLAFGGTRTYHRLTCAIEDAGFEVRDCLMWLYSNGFPKSLNLDGDWQGWGTALKPAYEPIVVARKPLIGTVAENVQRYGTGALNIDGCRIEGEPWKAHRATGLASVKFFTEGETPEIDKQPHDGGRWPANVALDPEAAAMLDEQSGDLHPPVSNGTRTPRASGFLAGLAGQEQQPRPSYDDRGGASRFFYCAKASTAERNAGLDGFEEREKRDTYGDGLQGPRPHTRDDYEWTRKGARNPHPTVKPIDLMRWLVRLVTPPGGLVLDPFAGSGTTGCAAVLEGFDFIGIEREPDYAAIARARIEFWSEYEGQDVEAVLAAEARARKLRESGQETLL